MDLHGPKSRVDARIDRVLKTFKSSSFTSADFINRFSETCPKTWDAIIERYGPGGKGTGTGYTSSGFIGTHLEKRSYNGSIIKLERVKAPSEWGNPWISVWANLSYEKDSLVSNSVIEQEDFLEGSKSTVLVNRYEREQRARKKCIEHYGLSCIVCRMDFGSKYGPIAKNIIHVHHIKPISSIGKQYKVDPVKDLRPICPNCHAVIHANKKPLSITLVRSMIKQASRGNL